MFENCVSEQKTIVGRLEIMYLTRNQLSGGWMKILDLFYSNIYIVKFIIINVVFHI
jgi:hypothetical protein